MIDRYTRPEMAALWTKQKKFETWLEVELNATDAWVKLGKVPAEAAAEMRKNAKFTVERVEEIEQSTRHDVVAFTRCVAESLGEESKYLHFGLTSTDVVDTALSSIVSQALDIIEADMRRFIDVLAAQAVKYKMTPCMGRTHGVHAEPTTLGLKFALWYAEMQRNLERMEHAHKITRVGKISGAVGTYANVDPFVEKYVCEQMGLEPSPISTQVLQRDRYAELLSVIAITGCSLEKFATEVRGLLNLRTTPDAMPCILEEKNVKMLTSLKVMSEAEIRSRYEIMLDNYRKTVNIEAETMVDMARRQILPAVEKFSAKLAQDIALKKAVAPVVSGIYEITLVTRLSDLVEEIDAAVEDLAAALAAFHKIDDVTESANMVRDVLLPKMEALRKPCDEAEQRTAVGCWPFPTYGDLLFGVQ